MTLDAAHYTQGDAFQLEKRTVFATHWLPIGVAQQLAQPGQFVTAASGGWPMLAVRGADGVLRAFRNTCRHKQMLLADNDSGTCDAFRCRFHGWTYDLSGQFLEAPVAVAPTGDHAQHGLTPMAVQAWYHTVLVNLQPDAAPVDFQPPTGLAEAQYVGAQTVDIGCNWKTLLEALLTQPSVRGCWPALVLHEHGDALWIDRIVPRTFLRTRLIRHAYGASTQTAALESLKSGVEALQAARAAGEVADISHARVAELHARLAEVYRSGD